MTEISLTDRLVSVIHFTFDVICCLFIGFFMVVKEFLKIFYQSEKDVRGKLVLVTGGGNGLGRAICLRFAELGSNLAVVDLNLKSAEATAKEARDLGVKAKAYKVDVTNADEIAALRKTLTSDFGTVDILVNNAGLMSNLNLEEKPANIEMMLKVNVLGPILMTKCFLSQMKDNQSGHIVSISSLSALHPTPFSIPYTATKFGINGFMSSLTEHLRIENWRSKIKTTCVFPYYINTRRDVVEFLNTNIRFPVLETDETACEVVKGILREDFNVTIPNVQKPLIKFMNIFPLSVIELINDRVLKERNFANKDCKLNFDFK